MKLCPCPSPPGGQVTCEDDQVAICRIIGGVPHGECITPPRSTGIGVLGRPIIDRETLRRWALEKITGRLKIDVTVQDIRMLESGSYVDPVTGEEVTFRLPASFFDDRPEPWARSGGG
jgi:hypothetical protein